MANGAPTGFIDFEIVGTRQGVQAMLEHLDSALSVAGLAAFMHGYVEPWLIDAAKKRFADEGDDTVGKWAPLQEATVAIREAGPWPVSGPGPINRRTGELEEYITGNGASVQHYGAGGASLTFPGKWSSKLSVRQKMETAQKGRANPSTVPRPVLGLGEKDLSHVLIGLALHVQGWK